MLGRIAEAVAELCNKASRRPAALGIGCPGLVDLEQGVSRFFPNLFTQWHGVPIRDRLSEALDCPVYLLNDVRAATLGELTFGHGRHATTMAFFSLGTGIGGGLAIDGRLRLGPDGMAGELGHQTVLPDGPLCGCGNRGCVETLANGPAITAEGVRLMLNGLAPKLRELTDGDVAAVRPGLMAAAAEAGDEYVREALVRAARFLGVAVSNVVVSLYPDLIVLAGGVSQVGDLLFDTVREVLRERVSMFPVDDIAIKPSLLGTRVGALGAVALAQKGPDLFQPRT